MLYLSQKPPKDIDINVFIDIYVQENLERLLYPAFQIQQTLQLRLFGMDSPVYGQPVGIHRI